MSTENKLDKQTYSKTQNRWNHAREETKKKKLKSIKYVHIHITESNKANRKISKVQLHLI